MKKSQNLKALRDMEQHYLTGLKSVRALIVLEGGEVDEDQEQDETASKKHSSGNGSNGNADFKSMTKSEATVYVLNETKAREFDKQTMFDELKKRGHPVAGLPSYTSMLSSSKIFKSIGNGKWEYTNPN